MPGGLSWRHRTIASTIAAATWLACTSALAQQASFVGTWGVQIPGRPFPVAIKLQLFSSGRFQQDLQTGSDACGHVMEVGNYSLFRPRDTYHFIVTGQVPLVDCFGHRLVPRTGWTAQLRLVNSTTLEWYDIATRNTVYMRRLQ